MSKRRYLHRSKAVQFNLDGSADSTEVRLKESDKPFLKAVQRVMNRGEGAVNRLPNVTDLRIRQANRGAHSGKPRHISLRIKADSYAEVESRADALGMNVSEYLRSLILADAGVVT
jgi:predicted DNA binding CopG/RHH family protein